MAYKTTVALSCVNRAAVLTELYSQMAATGWTLVDGNFTALTMAYTAVSVANDTFTTAGTVPANGTPCQISSSGTLPTGLSAATQYYIVNRTETTFKLATTYNGTAVNITAQGSGNHTVFESWRVYKSNGEDNDRIYEFIQIANLTANTINFYASYKYDSATKAFTGRALTTYPAALTTSESGCYFWFYGNKNCIHALTKISSTYYRCLFGHFNPWYSTPLTTLTADASSGSSVTISVSDTTGFEAGFSYQIVGNNMEGRDTVVVASITNSTQMVITSLPQNFSTGSKIGTYPSCFGHNRSTFATFYITCPWDIAGLTDCSSYTTLSVTVPFAPVSMDYSYRTQKYSLIPLLYDYEYRSGVNSAGDAGIGFYVDDFILITNNVGLSLEDTFAVGKLNSGTSSGSNSSTTLNDTSKSWTTNAYAGKVLIITFGAGLGQIKKIASNSATQLVLDTGWTFGTAIDATSQYVICEKGYRYIGDTAILTACREGY